MNVDEAFKRLGLIGKWQVLWYSGLILGCLFPGAWHIVSIVWIGYKPSHHCKLPDNTSMLEEWIPRQDNLKVSSCSMYVNTSVNNETMDCPNGWVFDESVSGPTIVSKWDMVCHRAYLVDTAQSAMTFGVLLGSLIFTKLSDTFGRKPILVCAQLSMSTIGALSVLPSNIHLYYSLRFLLGTFQQGVILCNLVMVCEMFSSQDRALLAIGGSALWGLANAFLPLIAYLTKNWVVLELIISLYGFLFIPFFWRLPESVPWLYANNRLKDAEETLLRAAKMNNITFTQPILNVYRKSDSQISLNSLKINENGLHKKKDFFPFNKGYSKKEESFPKTLQYSVLDLFKNTMLFKHLIICLLFGLVDNLVYYGLLLSSNSLTGNHYFNGFLNSIIEFPACILTFICVNRYGRKRPIAAAHVLAGFSLLATIVVSWTVGCYNTKSIILTALTTVGKFGITGAFSIVFFYVAELFPTNLRNQAVGICVFFARLGAILASYSTLVIERYPHLPPALFGALSIMVAVCIAFVPETHNKALPETIDEIKIWYDKPISGNGVNANDEESKL